ncbi:membrane-associated protein, putative [Bodo saltans]|uniref:Membrane-associated protein, putative n=1 Tax=Bodo saltans TaxID=75058 RepID=A0A0S4JCN3_BODSA|nr:membrane-associated protein, putative [Bodo saltans]|eukprot:CUG89316.1 membrane-associated protein, putative [Bodo saltans]
MFARIKCAKSSFAVSLLLVRLCSLCLFFPCYPFVSPFNLLHYMHVCMPLLFVLVVSSHSQHHFQPSRALRSSRLSQHHTCGGS